MKKFETKDFIEMAERKHGKGIYDYSKVEYTNNKQLVIIICRKHGEFTQRAGSHLQGFGCKKCAIEKHKVSLLHTSQ